MRIIFCVAFVIFSAQIAASQTKYTFIGNGPWTNTSNWTGNTIPPAILPSGDTIKINPIPGDTCILNTSQTISPGGGLVVSPGAIFIVLGGVTITGIIPVVRTDSVYNISWNSVTCKGSILSYGGSDILSKGFVWDTVPNPVISLPTKVYSLDTFDVFNSYIYNLQPGKTYYVRAFASNSAGVGYGNEKSFTTPLVNANGDSSFIDVRDGEEYTFRRIGNQVWMTKNLNYATDSSYCFRNYPANCNVFGKLYQWDEAFAAVPTGWHIPSDDEWQVLVNHLGGDAVAGGAMKSTSALWLPTNSGATNSSYFNALPGGLINNHRFVDSGAAAYFWTSSEIDTAKVGARSVYFGNTSVTKFSFAKDRYKVAVRCVRDDTSFPSLITDTAMTITDSSAVFRGIITSNGGSSITSTGLVWDTIPNPTINLSTKTVNTVITDTFNNTIPHLESHKKYYVRAYATNVLGTGYGSNRMFITNSDSTFTDPRDGKIYTFRHIGSQVWMTQNLNYDTSGASRCYDNNENNCDVYGRLYKWDVARAVIPPGWHLPSYSEMQTLATFVGGVNVAGGPLKATAFWTQPNTGATNSSGFTALPGGRDNNDGSFGWAGLIGFWWTSSADSFSDPYYLQITYDTIRILVQNGASTKSFSVRCIRD